LNPGDRVILELTDEQAVVLERAVELLFRLHIGQFNEIKFALLQHVHDTGANVDFRSIEILLDTMSHLFFPALQPHESFNVNCCEDSNIAYNIYQAVRYVNAWHHMPEGGAGVNFDPPHYTGVPIPKCYLKKEGEDHKDHDGNQNASQDSSHRRITGRL